MNDSGIVT